MGGSNFSGTEEEWKELVEKNKYFTPSIEDIRVGYEIQIHNWSMDELGDPALNYDRWDTVEINKGILTTLLKYGVKGIKVPYLTKEQIEEEGWKFSHRFEGGSDGRYEEIYKKEFPNGYYSLSINQFQFVTIHLWNCIDPKKPVSQTHWRGILPSINELRYISKLLGI